MFIIVKNGKSFVHFTFCKNRGKYKLTSISILYNLCMCNFIDYCHHTLLSWLALDLCVCVLVVFKKLIMITY